MRCVGYVRVSTGRQADEGVSLDAQRARIAAWCQAGGGELAPADLFVDGGLSGKRADNRPGLTAALEAVCRERGVLVVYSLSRLARSTKDAITIAERLAKAGADLVSLTESIDTTSAAGKMIFRLLAVLAEFERDLVSERTRAAAAYKRARGERVGQVPLGKAVDADGKRLVDDPAGLEAVRTAHRLRSESMALRAIAAELARLGHAPKNGADRWHHSTVAVILKRPVPEPESATCPDHPPPPPTATSSAASSGTSSSPAA